MRQQRVGSDDPRLAELLPSAFTPEELVALETSYAAPELSRWVFLFDEWRDMDSARRLAKSESVADLREREDRFLNISHWHHQLDCQA